MIDAPPPPPPFICHAPRSVDGDTLRCANSRARIRLLGIDAPELGKCRKGRVCVEGDAIASTMALTSILTLRPVKVLPEGWDKYGRILARVQAGGLDVSCALLASGHAVRRYSPISC
jgi:endonuclease YncB( thermonuclease family)